MTVQGRVVGTKTIVTQKNKIRFIWVCLCISALVTIIKEKEAIHLRLGVTWEGVEGITWEELEGGKKEREEILIKMYDIFKGKT